MGPDFLFAMPSVLSGVARAIDLGATFDQYNSSENEELADANALYVDWYLVGASLVEAMSLFAQAEPHVAQQATELAETPTPR